MSWPDWRKSKDYHSLAKLNAKGFAWEFLRRNSDFQSDVEHVQRGTIKDEYGNPPQEQMIINLAPPAQRPKFFFVPPKKPGKSDGEWMSESEKWELLTPSQYVARRWHLNKGKRLPNPEIGAFDLGVDDLFEASINAPRLLLHWSEVLNLPVMSSSPEPNLEHVGGEATGPDSAPLDLGLMVVAFSIHETPSAQWDRLRPVLDSERERRNELVKKSSLGASRRVLVNALRAWDAKQDSSVTDAERGKLIFKLSGEADFEQRYRDSLKDARRFIRGQYKDMLREGYKIHSR